MITKKEVEMAWADQVAAMNKYGNLNTEEAHRAIEEATQKAEFLQSVWDAKHSPSWCSHENIKDIIESGDPSGSVLVCKDCDAYYDEENERWYYRSAKI